VGLSRKRLTHVVSLILNRKGSLRSLRLVCPRRRLCPFGGKRGGSFEETSDARCLTDSQQKRKSQNSEAIPTLLTEEKAVSPPEDREVGLSRKRLTHVVSLILNRKGSLRSLRLVCSRSSLRICSPRCSTRWLWPSSSSVEPLLQPRSS
jgi:hypothetical protein